ncbi:MAG TPA: hydroxymethylbilane synthase [Thermoanaerobaculia bacterium]|nr:hydroxymethylbilane synthase [Thermoanaerobaculia bacterium]
MSAGRTLRLGTRRSLLALTQSGMVARELERRVPGLTVELVELTTKGDLHKGDLAAVGGKGLFTEELEAGLLDGSLDLAVHSLKDLPVTLPDGLLVAAYPERADPRDALVTDDTDERGLDGLPPGAVVLTGSLRRRAQVLARRPDLEVRPLRGNVDTRIRKWRELAVPGGVVLAQAGLDRLGDRLDEGLPILPLPPEQMLPAPGQGILAVETKAGSAAEEICRTLDDGPSRRAAVAERRVVAAFGGDCTLPLAAWARDVDGGLRLDALLAMPDGTRLARGTGQAADPEATAETCIAAMREDGADELLARIRESG